jgi:hypothetical protein
MKYEDLSPLKNDLTSLFEVGEVIFASEFLAYTPTLYPTNLKIWAQGRLW